MQSQIFKWVINYKFRFSNSHKSFINYIYYYFYTHIYTLTCDITIELCREGCCDKLIDVADKSKAVDESSKH